MPAEQSVGLSPMRELTPAEGRRVEATETGALVLLAAAAILVATTRTEAGSGRRP